jgi:hypothetical protein
MIDPQCGTCQHFWFREGDCTGAAKACEDYNHDMDAKPAIKTRLGTFQVTRKGAVAISVVKTKHPVRHHGKAMGTGAITHVEHRKTPRYPGSDTGWYTWIATFGMNGKELKNR